MEFRSFGKISRISRDCVITEKIDGTNACVVISDDGNIGAQSRNKIITPDDDNAGFAKWVQAHRDELLTLGPGYHFGEWWGNGIQRGYGLKEKRFSLFHAKGEVPSCVFVVPVLYKGYFHSDEIDQTLDNLRRTGSIAAPGFMNPEGIIIYHTGGGYLFKKTFDNDEAGKGALA